MGIGNILKEYELGIICIETAAKNGLRISPANNGADITIGLLNPDQELSKDQKDNATLVKEMLKKNKEALKMITSDKKVLHKRLIEGSEALSEANNGVIVLLDLLDRLLNARDIVFPGETECIFGDEGCPSDAVGYCNVCARKNGWKGVSYGN